MKFHVRLKLERPSASDGILPHWRHFIVDRGLAQTRLHPDVDEVFARYRLPVWVTKEYDSANRQWSLSAVCLAKQDGRVSLCPSYFSNEHF